MSEVMGDIGNFFSSGGSQAVSAGLGSAGLIGNLISGAQRNAQIKNLESAENTYSNTTPAQLSSMVASATQPLSQGLVEAVNNSVQGDVASRGLAEAPGIFAATEEQALAPFVQQNQQTALQLVMQKLGLPIQYASAIINALPPNTNLTPLLMSMMLKGGMSGNSTGPSSLPNNFGPANLLNLIQNGNSTPPTDNFVDPSIFTDPSQGVNA